MSEVPLYTSLGLLRCSKTARDVELGGCAEAHRSEDSAHWHWSHWPGRLVNRGEQWLFSTAGSQGVVLMAVVAGLEGLPRLPYLLETEKMPGGGIRFYRGTSLIRKRRPP